MDLLSCPQEMLARVFTYTTFETVTRIRKTNKHMDYVATKYRINLPRVSVAILIRYGKTDPQIRVQYKKTEVLDNKQNIDSQQSYIVNLTYNQYTALSVFEEIVKNIRSTCYIAFMDGELNRNVFDFLEKQQPRGKTALHISNCNFAFSMEELTSVLAKFSNSEIIIKSDNKIMNKPMTTEPLVISLLPYTGIHLELSIDDYFRRPVLLTNDTLQVARECLPHSFEVEWECQFSLAEIKKTMLRLIECFESKEKKFTSWKFGYLLMDSTEQLNQTVNEILEIPGTEIRTHRVEFACIKYKGDKWWNLFEICMKL